MPIPGSITDLSTTPSENSPQGSETVGTQANEYLQALSAFIRQIYNGSIVISSAFNFQGFKATNIAKGTISTTSMDAVRGDQLYTIGEVKMWHGVVANISTAWGPGWQLCDGTNGTADLRDKFVIGAGNTYAVNLTGGATTATLAIANMPSHNHPIVDPGHTHAKTDPGHKHIVFHDVSGGTSNQILNSGQGVSATQVSDTSTEQTNITINPAQTGINTTQSTGSGTAFSILNPYYALCFIEYVGA